LLLILLVSTILVGGGCGGDSESSTNNEIPEYSGLSLENLPDSKILDVPTTDSLGGFCYIESFAMQMAYVDRSITVPEVCAFSASGAALNYDSYSKAFSSVSPYPKMSLQYETHNYGVHYILGSAQGYSLLYSQADTKLTYKTADDALKYLKAVISTDRPVQVYIDLGYMHSHPKFSNCQPGKGNHWILVTGYDPNYVYMNEPYSAKLNESPNKYKNFKISLNEFLLAWEKGGDLSHDETQLGPYWMMFIEERNEGQLTRKKSIKEILSMQKELSSNNVRIIEKNLDSDFSNTDWPIISKLKETFGDYLIQIGYADAGNIFKELAGYYGNFMGKSHDEIKDSLNSFVKPKEALARQKY